MSTPKDYLNSNTLRTEPLITVISITLNDREGLTRTIKSLQAQHDPPNFEHIIVDGISDYDVADLIANLGSRAILKQGRDSGLYDAMNRGTELAQGDYLLYLNGGDILADKDILASIAEVLKNEQPDFLFGDSLERQLNGEIRYKSSRSIRRLPFGMITHHQAMLFRRSVIETHAIRYNLKYPIAADYDFSLRHVQSCKTTHYFSRPICIFERGGTSYQKRNTARMEQFHIRRAAYRSISFAAVVFVGQLALRGFRKLSPAGYWALRKRLG